MALSSKQAIRDRLNEAFDPTYYESVYRQMRYAFGEKFDGAIGTGVVNGGNVTFPNFPDLRVQYQEIGQSRRILNTAYISLARTMWRAPEPEFTQVDKVTAEMRKQFWLVRHEDGNWHQEMADAYLDADGMGVGFIQIGLTIDRDTKLPKVKIRHSPITSTLWDRSERNPRLARYCAFVHRMRTDDAVAFFGPQAAKYESTEFDSITSAGQKTVRFFEYFDIGIGGREPTRAIIFDDLCNEPFKVEPNTWGTRLPWAFCMHFLAPGMMRPIGRVALQMSTQEGLNEIERHLRRVLRQKQFTIVDCLSLDEDDLKRVAGGNTDMPVRWRPAREGTPNQPVIRVPAAEVAQTILVLREMLEKQFNADSGTTDLERGSRSENQTLGQDQLLDARSGAQGAWMERQATEFAIRTVDAVMYAAKIGDRAPCPVDVFNRNYVLNDPQDPSSSLRHVLEEPSRVLIGEQAMRRVDAEVDRAKRLELVTRLAQFAPPIPMVNPAWLGEELAKAAGEPDTGAFLLDPTQTAQAGENTPGVPMGMEMMGLEEQFGAPAPMQNP